MHVNLNIRMIKIDQDQCGGGGRGMFHQFCPLVELCCMQ